jgi:hypothetical protein
MGARSSHHRSMLKLMMGHSQSSNMGKTYYNVGEGSIGSVIGKKG